MQGVTLRYAFACSSGTNQLSCETTSVGADETSKALAEGFLSGTAFLNQGADFVIREGLTAALATRSAENHEATGLRGFAAIGGGSLRHNTGSHVDVDGYTLIAGLAASSGAFTAAAFLEHGEGDYDSYNSFSVGRVRGKGDTDYTGLGLMAQFELTEALTLEGSLRAGKVKTDFGSNDLGNAGQRAAYDAKSGYVSAHVGAGYRFSLGEQSRLKLYAHYLWSHQDGDRVRLTTGDPVKFNAVDSQRTRLGAKWDYQLNKSASAYLGAAWEHEFDGKAKATAYGEAIDAPELQGDTGILEAGLTLTPMTNQPLSIDLGLQGYTGKREGVTGGVRVRYAF
ncbi:MAG: autotransporter outer membrane beta-barrel domain-containing protein [Zoogloeaceae bacterium]|nr:autotransporter outer membrane beta-barrel domain-containing protein [Zoogloeaceae bacterium]